MFFVDGTHSYRIILSTTSVFSWWVPLLSSRVKITMFLVERGPNATQYLQIDVFYESLCPDSRYQCFLVFWCKRFQFKRFIFSFIIISLGSGQIEKWGIVFLIRKWQNPRLQLWQGGMKTLRNIDRKKENRKFEVFGGKINYFFALLMIRLG